MQIHIRPKVPVKLEKQRAVASVTAQCARKRLSAEEDAVCAKLANERSQNARNADRKDERIATDLSGYEIDLMGCKGELAVCKHLGIDWEPYVDRPDGGVDITLPDGRTIDVKSAQKVGHRLLFKRLDAFKADIAVLTYVHAHKRDVLIAGWCTREEFIAGHQRHFACKNSPSLEPSQLHPIETLYANTISHAAPPRVRCARAAFAKHLHSRQRSHPRREHRDRSGHIVRWRQQHRRVPA